MVEASITGYYIEVSDDDGSTWTSLVNNTGSTTTSYNHTGLSSGDERYYRISAINSVGTGSVSTTVKSTTYRLAGTPTDVYARAGSASQIDVSWVAPSSSGGTKLTGYRIQVSSDDEATWTDLVSDTESLSLSYSHVGLVAGDQRNYRVAAINSVGTGSNSSTAEATTWNVPDEITDLSVTVTDDDVDLSWTAPVGNGSTIVGYRIDVREDNGDWTLLIPEFSLPDTEYLQNNVSVVERDYRVFAVNSVGISTTSNVVSIATDEILGPPRNVSADTSSDTQIDLTWDAPLGTGGGTIQGYKIEISSDESAWTTLVANTGDVTEYDHTGLNTGDTRYYRISTITNQATSLSSDVVEETTWDSSRCSD